MGSSSKRRQTMAKMERERAVKEKRAKKQERREEKKAAREAEAAEPTFEPVEAETPAEL
jgi:hypothetical protein